MARLEDPSIEVLRSVIEKLAAIKKELDGTIEVMNKVENSLDVVSKDIGDCRIFGNSMRRNKELGDLDEIMENIGHEI